jgi:hypothetical protein
MNLDANQKRALRKMWVGDLTLEEIQDDLGITAEELAEAVESLGLPADRPPAAYLPSPQEIRQACASLRMNWTPAERESRLGRLK